MDQEVEMEVRQRHKEPDVILELEHLTDDTNEVLEIVDQLRVWLCGNKLKSRCDFYAGLIQVERGFWMATEHPYLSLAFSQEKWEEKHFIIDKHTGLACMREDCVETLINLVYGTWIKI